MKKARRGFTLVEVSLFLVITAAVFVGVAVGTQNSIFQQRYNDAVQNFAEFLRSVYSQVTNVQNDGSGRSDKAIYGKLVVFGESGGNNAITTYNVIGNAEYEGCSGKDTLGGKLNCLGVNVIVETEVEGEVEDEGTEELVETEVEDEIKKKEFKTVGWVEDYVPRWASQIQTVKGWDVSPDEGQYDLFEGALLIVRHPGSGTVHTLVYTPAKEADRIDVDGAVADSNKEPYEEKNPISKFLEGDGSTNIFEKEEVVFCVNPNGADRSNLRRAVKIAKNARNASGIEILPEGEKCNP